MTPLEFIDAHTHADNRSGEDFVRLAAVGCKGVVGVAGSDGGFRGPDSALDHFRRLATVDRKRVERAGLKFFLALGIHPVGIPEAGADRLLEELPQALSEYQAVAVGEIGLETGGPLEQSVLARQLELAVESALPAIIHTPRSDKLKALRLTVDLIERSGISMQKVLLDHLNAEVLPEVAKSGCLLGLSVHPAKLGPREAAELVVEYGAGSIVISTDMGANPSHLFGIPAAVSAMRDLGVDEEHIRAVVYGNAARFLGDSP